MSTFDDRPFDSRGYGFPSDEHVTPDAAPQDAPDPLVALFTIKATATLDVITPAMKAERARLAAQEAAQ